MIVESQNGRITRDKRDKMHYGYARIEGEYLFLSLHLDQMMTKGIECSRGGVG